MHLTSDLVTTGAIVAVGDIVVEAVTEAEEGITAADNVMPQKQGKKEVIMRTIKINQKPKKNSQRDHQVDTEAEEGDEAVDLEDAAEVEAVEVALTTAGAHAVKDLAMNTHRRMKDIARRTATIMEMLKGKVEIGEDAVVAVEDHVATDGVQDVHLHKVPATREINRTA